MIVVCLLLCFILFGLEHVSQLSVESVHMSVTCHSLCSTVFGDKKPMLTCHLCSKGFSRSDNLRRHRRKCEGAYDLSCQLCGMRFYRSDLYKQHMSSKHTICI